MSGFMNIINAIPWYAWIAIVGIIVTGVVKVVAMGHDHAERMEMIRSGMKPEEKSVARKAAEDW